MSNNIINIRIKRELSKIDLFDENRVESNLFISFTDKNNKFKLYKIPLLENRQYIVPDGVFKLKYEHSPKFKRKLWEFYDVTGRSEIKFHIGTNPEHSRGCPLSTGSGLAKLHSVLDGSKTYYISVEST